MDPGVQVRVYNEKFLVSVYHTTDPLTTLHFGRFGREEHSLVTVGRSGTLGVKILSRKSTLEGAGTGTGPPPEQDVPLSIPKKTKLFVEQTQREVEQAVAMHRLFQQDLCRIRLATARAFVKTLSETAKSPTGFAASASLRVNATVHGLGPLFKIRFMIVNTGAKTLTNVPVLYSAGPMYVLNRTSGVLPVLVPGLEYVEEVLVNCTDPVRISADISGVGGGSGGRRRRRPLRTLTWGDCRERIPHCTVGRRLPVCRWRAIGRSKLAGSRF